MVLYLSRMNRVNGKVSVFGFELIYVFVVEIVVFMRF